MKKRDAGLQSAIDAAGSVAELARRIGTSRQNVSKWRRVPPGRCVQVSKATGVSRKKLRADIYNG